MNSQHCTFVGRLATAPSLSTHKKADGTEGWRCFFRLAVTRLMDRGKPQKDQRANFIPCVTWGEAAKRHAEYLDKGQEISCSGELVINQERDDEGNFGEERFSVHLNEVQYGQKSVKNMSTEAIHTRIAALQAQLDTAGEASGIPVAPVELAEGETPFDAPAPASV